MPQQLTIELPDHVYQALQRASARTGQTPQQWLVERLQTALVTAEERAAQMAKIWRPATDTSDEEPKG